MKDNFIDEWVKTVDPELLASKLNEYEAARKPLHKW